MSKTFVVLWVLLGIPGAFMIVAKLSPAKQRAVYEVLFGIVALFMLGPIVTVLAIIYRNEPPSNSN